MKKTFLGLIISSFLLLSSANPCLAGWGGKKSEKQEKKKNVEATVPKEDKKAQSQKAVKQPQIDKKKEEELKSRREAEKQAKEQLSSKEWAINVKEINPARKSRAQADVLNFSEGKITSKSLSVKGYPGTNYTVTVQENNGTIIWETMQTNEGVGIAFWRGELAKGGTMTGVLTIQPKKGENEEYYFTTAALTETKAEPKAEPKPEPKKAEPKAEPKKSKKK